MCRSVTAAMAEYLPCLTAVALLGTRGLIRNSFIRLNAMICNSVAYSRKKKRQWWLAELKGKEGDRGEASATRRPAEEVSQRWWVGDAVASRSGDAVCRGQRKNERKRKMCH